MAYVIGDIHGEHEKLLALMKNIPLNEKLIFIGDYINKGSKSKEVVEYLSELGSSRETVFLIGNHEFKLLQAWDGNPQAQAYLKQYGFKETLESYLEKKLTDSEFDEILAKGTSKDILSQHQDFFKKLKPYYEDGQYFIVHAGIPLDEEEEFSLEPLEEMVFTREKFINLKKKYNNKIIIFGHTAFTQVFWDGYKLGIDTGAVYRKSNGYGRLTAVDLSSFECVDSEGERYKPKMYTQQKVTLNRKEWSDL